LRWNEKAINAAFPQKTRQYISNITVSVLFRWIPKAPAKWSNEMPGHETRVSAQARNKNF
jgi:hypothetical protein